MPNTAYTQLALAADPGFRTRVKAALLVIAAQILGEDSGIVNHNTRVIYANAVIKNPDGAAAQVAPFLVGRPNVNNFATTCQFDQANVIVVNATGDADLQSQIATDWNWLAAAAV